MTNNIPNPIDSATAQPEQQSNAKRKALSEEVEIKICNLCTKPFLAQYKHERYCKECPPSKRPKHGSKPLVERACAACTKPFTNRNERILVCSMDCSVEYKRMKKNKPLEKRLCKQCTEPFTPTGNHRACYCSSKCGSRAAYLRSKSGNTGGSEARCEKCGDPFRQYNSMHVYCDECSPSKKQRNQKITRICGLCDEPFEKSGKGFHKYCGDCREKYPHNMIHKSKEPCENCGKGFMHVNKEARFCSHSCSSTWLNSAGLGPRHDDDALHAHLINVIQAHEGSLSLEDLMYESGTAEPVLERRGWTIESLYQDAGRTHEPPRLCSYLEDRVYEVLCTLVPSSMIETQKDLPGMRGIKEGQQYTDFYIEKLKLIVEADGNIHRDPIFGVENLEYIQANDRKKNEYAAENGITIIRINETLNRNSIRAQLLRGIRHARPGFSPLNPSNALNTTGPARRGIVRGETRDRPNKQ